MKKLTTTGEWTKEILDEYYSEIENIAKEELKLDTYPNQIEIISSEQMLEAYSSHAMPIMYSHWRFGKDYVRNKNMYDKGQMNLAFEIVSNTNPCIAYLMEENSICMQALVIAHASFGHNAVFKNNYLFKQWTNADFIVDYLTFANKYITMCEEKYGYDAVEEFIDACHSIELYGVDRYKRPQKLSEFAEETEKLKSLLFEQEHYDDVISQTIKSKSNKNIKQNFEILEPQENLLYFLEKNSPFIEKWQVELIRIIRKISQYFYPQRQTKLLHEGFATATHYYIMNRLYDKGLVDDGFIMEFLDSHTSVVVQPTYDHPFYNRIGINVYALGFAMFQDIRRICENPTEEDRKWFPDIAGNSDWVAVRNDIIKNYRDESFILQYLSPKVMRDFKMFAIEDLVDDDEIVISNIHDDSGYRKIREVLAKMFDLNELLPNIQVTGVDQNTRRLTLTNFSKNKVDTNEAKKVLHYIYKIWGFPVALEENSDTDE